MQAPAAAALKLVAGNFLEGELMSSGPEWTLELAMDRQMIDAVLDELAQRGPQSSAIVTATRGPDSAAAAARRAAVKRREHEHPEWV